MPSHYITVKSNAIGAIDVGSQQIYWGHRCWLPTNHSYRKMKAKFKGKVKNRGPPKVISGTEILEQFPKDINVKFGKDRYFPDEYDNTKKKRKRRAKNSNDEKPIPNMPTGWKKKSIFCQLPY